jgi:uncharacterized RDD family membrane protein YckC
MRCPKCHYLSFEPEPRCRNCGFDLSGDPIDVALKRDEPAAPMADLALRPASEQAARVAPAPAVSMPVPVPAASSLSMASQRAASPPAPKGTSASEAHPREGVVARSVPVSPFRRAAGESLASRVEPPAPPSAPQAGRADPSTSGTSDLPLFVKGLSTAPAPPAPRPNPGPPPIAVQRPVQPPPRAAQPPGPRLPPRKPGPFDGDLLEDLQRIERIERGQPPDPPIVGQTQPAARALDTTGQTELWRGVLASAIDATFIGLVNVAIFWITLRWTNLSFVDASLLPMLPLGTFFVLVALGYLAMFTAAGGQTVGKMVAGVRVVAHDLGGEAQPITVQQALLRSVLAVPSVLLLGLGFLPAVLGSGKSLHDRLAQTRIVRA